MSWVVYSETVRRHLSNVSYYTAVAMFAIAAFISSRFDTLAGVWPPLVEVLAVVVGCAAIGPEFSSGTLQLILVKPVNRAVYLLSRVAGILSAVWLAAIVAFACELAGRAIAGQPLRADVLGKALLNTSVGAIMTVSLLVFFGTFTRAYFNVALYMLLQLGLGIVITITAMGRRFPDLVRVLDQILRNLFPQAPQNIDHRWMLMVLANASVALVLACLIFRRREVPYGGD
jgi:ABC-type transport system involved in multi-copper enzyme maturation permease subunit